MGGTPSIKVDLGSAVPFVWEKFAALIGKDGETTDLRQWFHTLVRNGYEESATIQCIGMSKPLPLRDIYRPTKLYWDVGYISLKDASGKNLNVDLSGNLDPHGFFSTGISAAIIAGPGWGKTTFLHYLFQIFLKSEEFVPILITLRREGALDDLEKLIAKLLDIKKFGKKKSLLLLVDGYDEIDRGARKKVSALIRSFKALDMGRIYLSCREFYDLYDLHLPSAHIAPFDERDQERYLEAFAQAYGAKISARELLGELRSRGLEALLQHPLLLALVCIVKSSSMSLHSHNVLVLIERALDVLMFRWDQSKGIDREVQCPIDGKSRLHCLMRIAYATQQTIVSDKIAMELTRDQLEKLEWDELDPREVLLETAKFYGIFVPVGQEHWQFVHKTLLDYLAARYMLETSQFNPEKVKTWTSRYAYAACSIPDATGAMLFSLQKKDSFPAFVEMLTNGASFKYKEISDGLITHYEQFPKTHYYEELEDRTALQLSADYISLASTKFLQYLTERCSTLRGKARDTFFAYSAAELLSRGKRLSYSAYANAVRTYGVKHQFQINYSGAWKTLRVQALKPLEDEEPDL